MVTSLLGGRKAATELQLGMGSFASFVEELAALPDAGEALRELEKGAGPKTMDSVVRVGLELLLGR